jgi:hypothetical protein
MNRIMSKLQVEQSGVQIPIQLVLGFLHIWLKWHMHENDHSPSSSKVKDELNYTSTPPIHLHDMYTDDYTFTLPQFTEPIPI